MKHSKSSSAQKQREKKKVAKLADKKMKQNKLKEILARFEQ